MKKHFLTKWLKTLVCHAGILALSIVVGWLLLVLVNCIPAEAFVEHATETVDVFRAEGIYPQATQHEQSRLDNYTDSLMIGEAAYAWDDPFDNALMTYRYTYDDLNPFYSYLSVWTPNEDNMGAAPELISEEEYPRYWHGFLVLLKPLLVLLNYGQIRVLNTVMLSILFAAVLVLMARRRRMRANIAPLVVTALFMIPQAVGKSLQFSTTTYITLLSLILILSLNRQRSVLWYSLLFAVIGIATVYFDFLTFPTLSLCIPLCTLLTALDQESVQGKGKLMCACSASWFFGYGGMWAGKWLVCLLSNPDFLEEYVLPSIKLRAAETNALQLSRGEVLQLRFADCFFNPVYVALFVLLAGAALCWLILRCLKDKKCYVTQLLPYLPLLAVPFVWIAVLCNHSAVHWFTYRTFMTVIYVVPAALAAAVPAKSTLLSTDKEQVQ